jgi:hypothetical protein
MRFMAILLALQQLPSLLVAHGRGRRSQRRITNWTAKRADERQVEWAIEAKPTKSVRPK